MGKPTGRQLATVSEAWARFFRGIGTVLLPRFPYSDLIFSATPLGTPRIDAIIRCDNPVGSQVSNYLDLSLPICLDFIGIHSLILIVPIC